MIEIELKPLRPEHRILTTALYDPQVSREELSSICYKWTVEYALNEFEYAPLPCVPIKVKEWRQMDCKVRKGLDERTIRFFEDICVGYFKHHQHIYWDNMAKLEWLYVVREYLEGHLEEGDNANRLQKVLGKIDGYESKGCRI